MRVYVLELDQPFENYYAELIELKGYKLAVVKNNDGEEKTVGIHQLCDGDAFPLTDLALMEFKLKKAKELLMACSNVIDVIKMDGGEETDENNLERRINNFLKNNF